MAIKTKYALKQQSNTTYPTNGLGKITAASVRAFNGDVIDSMLSPDDDWLDLLPDLSVTVYPTVAKPDLFIRKFQVKTFSPEFIMLDVDLEASSSRIQSAVLYADTVEMGDNQISQVFTQGGASISVSTLGQYEVVLYFLGADGDYSFKGRILLPM